MKASYQIGEDVCVIGGHHSQLSCLQCEEKEIREEKLTGAAGKRGYHLSGPLSLSAKQSRASWVVLKWPWTLEDE